MSYKGLTCPKFSAHRENSTNPIAQVGSVEFSRMSHPDTYWPVPVRAARFDAADGGKHV